MRRTFPQIKKSLGISSYYNDGVVEGLEHQVEILKNLVIVLVGLLENHDVLTPTDAQLLSRVKYSNVERLEEIRDEEEE